jgi:N12 class adenine-specific DNA methylase
MDTNWPTFYRSTEVAVNRYFLSHPDMVLGCWSRKDSLYGEGYSVTGNGDLAELLSAAIRRLPKFAPLQISQPHNESRITFTPPPVEPFIAEGSFFIGQDRTIQQIVDGQSVPVVYGGTRLSASGTMTGKRLAALIGLRDRAPRPPISKRRLAGRGTHRCTPGAEPGL